jgi:hypothetical protein
MRLLRTQAPRGRWAVMPPIGPEPPSPRPDPGSPTPQPDPTPPLPRPPLPEPPPPSPPSPVPGPRRPVPVFTAVDDLRSDGWGPSAHCSAGYAVSLGVENFAAVSGY